jgi:hypothetical protein
MERVSQLAGAFLTFAPEIWIYLADRSLGAAPGLGELGCYAQNFVAARSTMLRIQSAAPACEGVMSFLGLNASTRFMRARAPTSAISYIRHSKMKTPEGGLHAVFLFLYTKGASANFAEK